MTSSMAGVSQSIPGPEVNPEWSGPAEKLELEQ